MCSARYTLLIPPVPMWPSSLYLPRKKPLYLPPSSFSMCQSVIRPLRLKALAIFWGSLGNSPWYFARIFSSISSTFSSSTKPLLATMRRNFSEEISGID